MFPSTPSKLYYNTPLHLAATHKDPKSTKILLDAKANIEAKNINGETPVFIALSEWNLDVVRFLVKNGADTKVVDNNDKGLLKIFEELSKLNEHFSYPENIDGIRELLVEDSMQIAHITGEVDQCVLF